MKRVLVCGGRDYTNEDRLEEVLIDEDPDFIIQGGATGADRLAKLWAIRHSIHYAEVPALWNQFGRSAGPIRNNVMLRFTKPDLVIAFPGGRGTQDLVDKAIARNIPVRVVES